MSNKKRLNNFCKEEGGILKPLIDFNDCGGKEDCIEVCPYDVLEMRPITPEDKSKLNFKGRIKTFFNKQKAYITDVNLCHACGLCVQVCPEKAIKLTKITNK
ncbi:4Fe-4S dicluster domain-containing protein [Flagellimonas sp. S174]|uniref:4Fe-4S dicluster domain-containing protein n=1 Tax=Flagellimonas sp. S174 TaxID=3410790 RepID=UPI003BF512DD